MTEIKKCPNCGSTRLYNEISIMAKKNVNTGKIYSINKDNEDNFFEPLYCDKCGWSDEAEVLNKMRNSR